MKTSDLIVRAKQFANLSTDYALSKRLGTSTATVCNWANGRSVPDTWFTIQLALLAQVDPLQAIAEIESERAERAHAQAALERWKGFAAKMGGVAATILMGTVITAPSPAPASMKTADNAGIPCVHYVNSHNRVYADLSRLGIKHNVS